MDRVSLSFVVQQLAGMPLTLIYTMHHLDAPVGCEDLAALTNSADQTVRRGLRRLELLGLAERIARYHGWRLTSAGHRILTDPPRVALAFEASDAAEAPSTVGDAPSTVGEAPDAAGEAEVVPPDADAPGAGVLVASAAPPSDPQKIPLPSSSCLALPVSIPTADRKTTTTYNLPRLEQTPGHGPEQTPDHGPEQTPDHGPEQTPGHGPEQTPGNPESAPDNPESARANPDNVRGHPESARANPESARGSDGDRGLSWDADARAAVDLIVAQGMVRHARNGRSACGAVAAALDGGWTGAEILDAVRRWVAYVATPQGATIRAPGPCIAARIRDRELPPPPPRPAPAPDLAALSPEDRARAYIAAELERRRRDHDL